MAHAEVACDLRAVVAAGGHEQHTPLEVGQRGERCDEHAALDVAVLGAALERLAGDREPELADDRLGAWLGRNAAVQVGEVHRVFPRAGHVAPVARADRVDCGDLQRLAHVDLAALGVLRPVAPLLPHADQRVLQCVLRAQLGRAAHAPRDVVAHQVAMLVDELLEARASVAVDAEGIGDVGAGAGAYGGGLAQCERAVARVPVGVEHDRYSAPTADVLCARIAGLVSSIRAALPPE